MLKRAYPVKSVKCWSVSGRHRKILWKGESRVKRFSRLLSVMLSLSILSSSLMMEAYAVLTVDTPDVQQEEQQEQDTPEENEDDGRIPYHVTGGDIYLSLKTDSSGSDYWEVVDCEYTITEATIPDNIDGMPVTVIGDYAFERCYGLASVTIPNSVTSIGDCAFNECYCLTSVTIPDSVISIGHKAFMDCGLSSVNLPDNLTSIGNHAFYRCYGLANVTIPDSVTIIGDCAFAACKLTSVTIPDSVTNIGGSAFDGCSGLTSVTISNGVTNIGDRAFMHCDGLTSVTIPNSVTFIGGSAFRSCDNLTYVIIPDSVTDIGEDAFDECGKLKDIYFSGSKAQWESIIVGYIIGSNLEYVKVEIDGCTIHYNSTGPDNPGETDPADHAKYTVTFDANGGKLNDSTSADTGTDGKLLGLPSDPTRPGYKFDGWYTSASGGDKVSVSHVFTADTTVYAHWVENTGTNPSKKYTVTFDANGGKLNGSTSADTGTDGRLSGLPKEPTRTGYKFDGWYTSASGGDKVSTNYTFTADTTVYAHWVTNASKKYTITFDANGGKLKGSETLTTKTNGKLSSLPKNPTRSGYKFDGWYTSASGGDKVSTNYTFTDDTTVYAHWDVNESNNENKTTICTVTFDANGGKLNGRESVVTGTDGRLSEFPADPSRSGHIFKGWYTNKSKGLKISNSYVFTKDTKVYAHWKAGKVQSETSTSGGVSNGVGISGNHSGTGSSSSTGGNANGNHLSNSGHSTSGTAFADVPSNVFFTDAVDWAVQKGVTSGTTPGTFSPYDSCTRAQTVTFIWRAAGSPKPKTNKNPFTDVTPGLYFYNAVLWALENNITSGATATTFNPYADVTRAQTVTFLYRSAGSPSVDGVKHSFHDVDDSLYFSDAVKWATMHGITSGTTGTTFSPYSNCTRGQIVTFLHRAE